MIDGSDLREFNRQMGYRRQGRRQTRPVTKEQRQAVMKELRAAGVESGRRGGRPAKKQHDPKAKRCKCAACRRRRGEAPYGKAK